MHGAYRDMELRTASPVLLVVKMYEGAIRHVRAARTHHESGDTRGRGSAVSRALAIVGELRNSLDFERGGEIARNLDGLYGFASERLLDASLRGRAEAFDEVLGVLEPLREAWSELSRQPVAAAGAAAAAAPEPAAPPAR